MLIRYSIEYDFWCLTDSTGDRWIDNTESGRARIVQFLTHRALEAKLGRFPNLSLKQESLYTGEVPSWVAETRVTRSAVIDIEELQFD